MGRGGVRECVLARWNEVVMRVSVFDCVQVECKSESESESVCERVRRVKK